MNIDLSNENVFRYGAREDIANIRNDIREVAFIRTASEIEAERLLSKRHKK